MSSYIKWVSKADPDIWLKSSNDDNHYEYIAVYVDDLAICMKDPKRLGVGQISYHLGCEYTRDEDEITENAPKGHFQGSLLLL